MRVCTFCKFRMRGLFKALSDEALNDLSEAFSTRHCRAKDVVFHQGSPVEGFYILCDGAVKLVRESPQGKQAIVDIVGPCQPFGELSFDRGAVQSVTAEVVGSAAVHYIPRGAMVMFFGRTRRCSTRWLRS
ncbi:MAG: cyclic nucleotide-binding domain-containing protein [Nitrospinota bacterium]